MALDGGLYTHAAFLAFYSFEAIWDEAARLSDLAVAFLRRSFSATDANLSFRNLLRLLHIRQTHPCPALARLLLRYIHNALVLRTECCWRCQLPLTTGTNFDTAPGRRILHRILSDWCLYFPNPTNRSHRALIHLFWLHFYGNKTFGQLIATHGITHWPSLIPALATALETLQGQPQAP